jgi:hypothetical protein
MPGLSILEVYGGGLRRKRCMIFSHPNHLDFVAFLDLKLNAVDFFFLNGNIYYK